jgi:hypothetical protein
MKGATAMPGKILENWAFLQESLQKRGITQHKMLTNIAV